MTQAILLGAGAILAGLAFCLLARRPSAREEPQTMELGLQNILLKAITSPLPGSHRGSTSSRGGWRARARESATSSWVAGAEPSGKSSWGSSTPSSASSRGRS